MSGARARGHRVAGGLVPSPSGVFGVVLALAYGAGIAGTLTAVGLMLLLAQRRITAGASHPARVLAGVGATMPRLW